MLDFLGAAAFSQAVQALDTATGALVCLKIIKNNKDYFDQSLDEIKLLRYVNAHDPEDAAGVVRLYDFFYFREHLFLVREELGFSWCLGLVGAWVCVFGFLGLCVFSWGGWGGCCCGGFFVAHALN